LASKITTLIGVDAFELLRDQIAAVLLLESEGQRALATAAGKDANLWKLRAFTEAANPWYEFPQADDPEKGTHEGQGDTSPLVNVTWNRNDYDRRGSDTVQRQATIGKFHLDCYGYGVSRAAGAGHEPGDMAAALEAARAVRLVRGILMSAHYVDLGMKGTVWERWLESAEAFPRELNERPVQQVAAVRMTFHVKFNELSPQWQGETLELISLQVKRQPDGKVVIAADYPIP
jgi:hypothetical protein